MKYTITTIPERKERADALKEELTGLGYEGDIHLDGYLLGPWLAVKQVLHDVVKSGESRIILQDDIILGSEFKRCQKDLETYLGEYGLISLFTPHS